MVPGAFHGEAHCRLPLSRGGSQKTRRHRQQVFFASFPRHEVKGTFLIFLSTGRCSRVLIPRPIQIRLNEKRRKRPTSMFQRLNCDCLFPDSGYLLIFSLDFYLPNVSSSVDNAVVCQSLLNVITFGMLFNPIDAFINSLWFKQVIRCVNLF